MPDLVDLHRFLNSVGLYLACWISDQTKERLLCLVREDPGKKPVQQAFFIRSVYYPDNMGYSFYPTPDGKEVPVLPVNESEIPVSDEKFWEKLDWAFARIQHG